MWEEYESAAVALARAKSEWLRSPSREIARVIIALERRIDRILGIE